MFANIVIDTDANLSQTFTYRVPDELVESVFEGACVVVSFGTREQVGYILELTEEAPDISGIKDITTVLSDACALTPPLISLARWISDRYTAPLAHSIRAVVPEVMSATISTTVRLLDPTKVSAQSPNQKRIVEVLAAVGGESDSETLKARARMDNFGPALRQLSNRGAVEIVRGLELPKARPLTVRGLKATEDEIFPEEAGFETRAPKQAAIVKELSGSESPLRQSDLLKKIGSTSSPVRALLDKGLVEKVDMKVRRRAFRTGVAEESSLELTEGQEKALDAISVDTPHTTLLYGVTGSGKTEVYLRSISEMLERGRGCIALVPEITLTTHLMESYVSRFGDQLAVLHSKLSTGERHDEWRRIESGEARVVLGPRSAVFAPIQNLGLIILDEEHEPSYKQENSPRYNARAVAEERARLENASVVLGSATPSIETYYRARQGQIDQVSLPTRIDDRPMPIIHSVDLREEFEQGRRSFFSKRLEEAIADRIAKNEQVILFLNRRGYASFILCRSCGYTAKCTNCDLSLTYHAGANLLRCHHCNSCRPSPTTCPECGGPHIRQFGVGTERVEAETLKVFPDARVIRMDSDTTSRKGSHAALLKTFSEGKADILIGTQMVAKGLDFPNVTLVGVISADTTLNLPDFRSAERTFQLLTQVSGRAGRGDIPGEVIVQSFSPDHYAVEAAASHDFDKFYEQEIAHREELSYPPFSRLINIVSSDPVNGYAESRLCELANVLRERIPDGDTTMLGPAPAPIAKLKGLFRWHVMLKSCDGSELPSIVKECLNRLPAAERMALTVDVDPMTML